MDLPAHHPFRSAKAKEEHLARYDLRAQQWPVASENRMVETSYGPTFVRISGAPNAPALVLMHGALANSLMWMQNIAALSASYRTYAVDNIYDYGRSVYTRQLKGSDDFVNWMDELFTALGLGDPFCLLGMSYGGWLTAQYALRFPTRLAKIVLLAPGATVLPLSLKFWMRALLAGLHPHFFRVLLRWILGGDTAQENTRKQVEEGIEDILVALRCFTPKAMVLATVLSDQELQSLRMPTLFMVGEHEKAYSARKAVQRLKAVAPQIKTEIIPGAGHNLLMAQAEMVDAKILEFLR
jgi:pimeloyl-ACP methyl ester carboxylesterase